MDSTVKQAKFIVILVVSIIFAIVVGGVIVSKITCKHDNEYEIKILEYKAPTCQKKGLTSGKKCTYCGKTLVRQEKIDKIPCKESDWIIDKHPSSAEYEGIHKECTMCGKVLKKEEVIIGTKGLNYSKKYDGTCCLSNDGIVDVENIAISTIYNEMVVTVIEYQAFSNNKALSIVMPNTIVRIESSAFYKCKNLTEINIPNSVVSIGQYAFYECESLKTIDLPENLTKIEQSTFYKCTSLESITIPKNVKEIEYSAFAYCQSLITIEYEGTVEQWNEISLDSGWNQSVPATQVVCVDGTVSIK